MITVKQTSLTITYVIQVNKNKKSVGHLTIEVFINKIEYSHKVMVGMPLTFFRKHFLFY